MDTESMNFIYKDKETTKQKFLEIATNPILPGLGPGVQRGLVAVLRDIDLMKAGDVQTWVVEINFSGGFSDKCQITLDLSELVELDAKEFLTKHL